MLDKFDKLLRYKFYSIDEVIQLLEEELSTPKTRIVFDTITVRTGSIVELPVKYDHRIVLKYVSIDDGISLDIHIPSTRYKFNVKNVEVITLSPGKYRMYFSKVTFNPNLHPSLLLVYKFSEIKLQIQTIRKPNLSIDVQFYSEIRG